MDHQRLIYAMRENEEKRKYGCKIDEKDLQNLSGTKNEEVLFKRPITRGRIIDSMQAMLL